MERVPYRTKNIKNLLLDEIKATTPKQIEKKKHNNKHSSSTDLSNTTKNCKLHQQIKELGVRHKPLSQRETE